MRRPAVVLLSGGMDSTVALYDACEGGSVAAALSVQYGSKHNAQEIPWAAWHCARLGLRHETVVLDWVGRLFRSGLLEGGGAIPEGHYAEETMRQTVVPFRNALFLSIACGFAESAGAGAVVIAAHAGDHAVYPDCREPFMQAMGEAMRLGTYAGIELRRPFIAMDKAAIVRRGMKLGVDFSKTWSCYCGGARHCGACGTCVERREAFLLAGVPDPTEYERTGPLPPPPL